MLAVRGGRGAGLGVQAYGVLMRAGVVLRMWEGEDGEKSFLWVFVGVILTRAAGWRSGIMHRLLS